MALESADPGSQNVERTIQVEVGPLNDMEQLFPQVCEQLGVPADNLDDWCLCVRENDFVISNLEALSKYCRLSSCCNVVANIV